MILPILISESLAPGSYFFCALAAVATNAATVSAARATRLCIRTVINFSLSPFFDQDLFWPSFASCFNPCKHVLVPRNETDGCCAVTIVVRSGDISPIGILRQADWKR